MAYPPATIFRAQVRDLGRPPSPRPRGGAHAQTVTHTFKGECRFGSARTAAGNTRKSDGPLVFRQGAGNQMNCLELQQY